MAEFTVQFREYYCGDYDTIDPKVVTLPGVERRTAWRDERLPENWTTEIKAVLNEDGNPVIARERVETKPGKEWFGKGRNHQHANGYYTRETEYGYWVINLNTLEELLDFARTTAADLDAENMILTVEWESGWGQR